MYEIFYARRYNYVTSITACDVKKVTLGVVGK